VSRIISYTLLVRDYFLKMLSIDIQEPWYTHVKNKKKTIEGKLNKGTAAKFKLDDIVIVYKHDMSENIMVKVKRLTKYSSFREYLSIEGLNNTLPEIQTIEDGENIYYKFYTKENEKLYGILAVEIEVID